MICWSLGEERRLECRRKGRGGLAVMWCVATSLVDRSKLQQCNVNFDFTTTRLHSLWEWVEETLSLLGSWSSCLVMIRYCRRTITGKKKRKVCICRGWCSLEWAIAVDLWHCCGLRVDEDEGEKQRYSPDAGLWLFTWCQVFYRQATHVCCFWILLVLCNALHCIHTFVVHFLYDLSS